MKKPNGEGTITFDKARGRYVGRVSLGRGPDGKPIRKKFTGRTQTEVLRRMAEAKNARAKGLPVADDRLKVEPFLRRWLTTLPGTVAEATEAAYENKVRLYIVPVLGHLPLTRLAPSHVTEMLRGMEQRGLSVETRRQARAVLGRALRYAEQEGLVGRNVARIAPGPRFERREGRSLTQGQAQAFLKAARSAPERRQTGPAPTRAARLYPALLIALALGLRRGEVLGLSWADVDLDADRPSLRVRKQLVRRPKGRGLGLTDLKTPKSRRVVILPLVVVDALRAHRVLQAKDRMLAGPEWQNEADLVFTTPIGTPIDPRNFNTHVEHVAKAAGLGSWHPHELRHSAGSLLVAAGVPLSVVSDMLGHSSIRITNDIYIHLMDEAKQSAADAMERVLGEGVG